MLNNKYMIIIALIFTVTICYSQEKESVISGLSNVEIDSILTEVSEKNLTVTEKMKFYSTLFLDMPYDLICAGDGNDKVHGGQGEDIMFGEEGDDNLLGQQGSDFLHGGPGDDMINGGPGSDTCIEASSFHLCGEY